MPSSPGTVSKILWHFTGGPKWNEAQKRQEKRRKSAKQAYNALIGILKSRELRIGQYKEVIKVKVRSIKTRDEATGAIEEETDAERELISAPVCCLADIPIVHLDYHSERYGKFAIGFHRAAAIRHKFHPVFYQLHDSDVLLAIYAGMRYLGDAKDDLIEHGFDDIDYLLKKIDEDANSKQHTNFGEGFRELRMSLQSTSLALRKFLAFIKTFDASEFGTIYCEREWRSVKPFEFKYDDISMIALPRSKDEGNYFERFVKEAKSIPLPPTVSIVAWDDLVEH